MATLYSSCLMHSGKLGMDLGIMAIGRSRRHFAMLVRPPVVISRRIFQ
ncbi:hypothetical protein ABIC16_004033 [Sphingomonas sp. PvP055]